MVNIPDPEADKRAMRAFWDLADMAAEKDENDRHLMKSVLDTILNHLDCGGDIIPEDHLHRLIRTAIEKVEELF